LLIQQVFRLLRRSSGIDFGSYKLPTLKRRMEKRIALHRLPGLPEYVDLLARDPSELEQLQGDLLIHVTSFFREPQSYQALGDLVFPKLLARKPDEPAVRIWVPGCSTGEEVYSLAMIALEVLGQRADGVSLQIFGTDVSERAVEKARAGVYPMTISSDVSAERLRRFFSRFDGGYRINKDVRDRCVFARQDVTRDPPFSKLDLVVCRNVLIYLTPPVQRKVLGVFHYALRPHGLLLLGEAETIGSRADLFSLFAKGIQLYRKKSEAGEREAVSVPVAPQRRASSAAVAAVQQSIASGVWEAQGDANQVLLDRYAPPAVMVDEDSRIVRSRGSTAAFLELPSGPMTADIMKIVRPELGYALRGLLREARARGRATAKSGVRFTVDGRARSVDLHVLPIRSGADRHFLILFENHGGTKRAGKATGVRVPKGATAAWREELTETRRQLQSIIDDLGAANEELQSANEEILSSNEELQSTNEELDTAKEELQSTNEELATVNEELRGRNEELAAVNSDLSNLLASVQIPIVMVTRDLRIRRVTPAAEKVLNIIPSDIGRPIGHIRPNFTCPDLEALIAETIETVSIREREVEGTDGRTFALQIRPYQTLDNRIDGALVVLFDVSSAEESAAALQVALTTGQALIPWIRDPVLLLDSSFKVRRANPAFLNTFGVTADAVAGRNIFEIRDKEWDVPELRKLLEEVLPQQKDFQSLSVELGPSSAGRARRFELDAYRIESGRKRQGVILLIIREMAGHESTADGADAATIADRKRRAEGSPPPGG